MGFEPKEVVESVHDLGAGERAWLLRVSELDVGDAYAVTALAPDEALARWRALAEGEWTLVDSMDHGGRRYVVARRTEDGRRRGGGLSPREREVATHAAGGMGIKEIATALGLSSSTVGTHLASAKRKLRVRTRAELTTMIGLVGEAPP